MSKNMDHYRLAYDLFAELDEGQQAKELAKILDISEKTVRNWRTKPKPVWIHGKLQVPQVKLDEAEGLLDDGASYYEAARTVGIRSETLRQHFPGRGWSQEQVIDYAVTVRKFNQKIRKAGI